MPKHNAKLTQMVQDLLKKYKGSTELEGDYEFVISQKSHNIAPEPFIVSVYSEASSNSPKLKIVFENYQKDERKEFAFTENSIQDRNWARKNLSFIQEVNRLRGKSPIELVDKLVTLWNKSTINESYIQALAKDSVAFKELVEERLNSSIKSKLVFESSDNGCQIKEEKLPSASKVKRNFSNLSKKYGYDGNKPFPSFTSGIRAVENALQELDLYFYGVVTKEPGKKGSKHYELATRDSKQNETLIDNLHAYVVWEELERGYEFIAYLT